MGLTMSNCGVFIAPGFIISPMGKGERIKKEKEEGWREKQNRKGMEKRKEEGIKKDRKTERNMEFRGKEEKKIFCWL